MATGMFYGTGASFDIDRSATSAVQDPGSPLPWDSFDVAKRLSAFYRMTEEQWTNCIQMAVETTGLAYAPYSNFNVGCCILTEEGEYFLGANCENTLGQLTICAERVAAVQASMAGRRAYKAVFVASTTGTSPCGSCRAFLQEFGDPAIVMLNVKDKTITDHRRLSILYPNPPKTKER